MRHSLRMGLCMGGVVLATATALAIGTIKELSLDDGRDDVNRLTAPAVDGSRTAVAIGTIAADLRQGRQDRAARRDRVHDPRSRIQPRQVARPRRPVRQRPQAGSRRRWASARRAPSAWQVDGTIKDVYVESKQIPYGATLFYGFMDVDFRVAQGGAAPQTVSMRLHNYNGGYNAGMGRKDEAMVALAHLLVEGAQEALARLNRLHFKAPPHPGVAALIEQVKTMGEQRPARGAASGGAVRVAGGAGGAAGAGAARSRTRTGRSSLIEALGRLGAADAVPVLSQRYAPRTRTAGG